VLLNKDKRFANLDPFQMKDFDTAIHYIN